MTIKVFRGKECWLVRLPDGNVVWCRTREAVRILSLKWPEAQIEWHN